MYIAYMYMYMTTLLYCITYEMYYNIIVHVHVHVFHTECLYIHVQYCTKINFFL